MTGSPIRLEWKQLLGFDQACAVVEGKAPPTTAKVGSKDPVVAGFVSLGRNLDAKVGQKNPDVVPSAMAAKIGFKNN